jgi:hypothetical protein
MGRSRRPKSDGEIKDIQRLKLENQKLKKQISKLRKELSRVDIDRYQHLRDLIESQDREDESFDSKVELENLKRKWECHTCGKDYLRLILVPRLDGTFYFRRCPTCMNKTKMKKYTSGVEGISLNDEVVTDPQNED